VLLPAQNDWTQPKDARHRRGSLLALPAQPAYSIFCAFSSREGLRCGAWSRDCAGCVSQKGVTHLPEPMSQTYRDRCHTPTGTASRNCHRNRNRCGKHQPESHISPACQVRRHSHSVTKSGMYPHGFAHANTPATAGV
jgi:hypothetical protein